MKQALFKINTLLIVTSCLAISIATAGFFIETKQAASPYVEVIDTGNSPKLLDSAQAMISTGEVLFKENCKACHAVHTQEVGPALHGVSDKRSKNGFVNSFATMKCWFKRKIRQRLT